MTLDWRTQLKHKELASDHCSNVIRMIDNDKIILIYKYFMREADTFLNGLQEILELAPLGPSVVLSFKVHRLHFKAIGGYLPIFEL